WAACLLPLLFASSSAFQAHAPALRRPSRLHPHPILAAPSDALSDPDAEDKIESEGEISRLGKARAWVKKYATIDKKQLASLGFDAFFTYGLVSNLNGASGARVRPSRMCCVLHPSWV
ncbi:MAG: hypothetical protein SGPRY_006309, partial [Prymnesium sp.]